MIHAGIMPYDSGRLKSRGHRSCVLSLICYSRFDYPMAFKI